MLPSRWNPHPAWRPFSFLSGTCAPELPSGEHQQPPGTSRFASQGSDAGLPPKHASQPPDAFGIVQGAAVGAEPGGLADTALKKKEGEKLVEKCPLQPSC